MRKYLGIVRKLDKLGRVVVPKELRKTFKFQNGTPIEIIGLPDVQAILIRKFEGTSENESI